MPLDNSFDWSKVKPVQKAPVSPPQSRPLLNPSKKSCVADISFWVFVMLPLLALIALLTFDFLYWLVY